MMYGDWIIMWALLGLTFIAQMAQCALLVSCPPDFPNMESFFERTLQFGRMSAMYKEIRMEFDEPPRCTCANFDMEALTGGYQCRNDSQMILEYGCPTTTTQTTTTPTTTTTPSTTTTGRHTIPHIPLVTTPIDRVFSTELPSTERTTPCGINSICPVPPDPGPVSQSDNNVTVVVVAIGAGIVIVIILVGLILFCRKHFSASPGAVGTGLKREKLQHRRSDCQPIASITRKDMYDNNYSRSPSMETVNGGFNRGYLSNGEKWRPEYEWAHSEDGSEKSHPGSKYILLREDSTSSAYLFDQHYQTLKAIDHPHALMMGGFGESSSDMTLPRGMRKKSVGSLSSMRELDETELGITAIDNNKNTVKKYGILTGRKPSNVPDSGRGSSESSNPPSPAEVDRHSISSVGKADSILDVSASGFLNPCFSDEVEDPVHQPAAIPDTKWQQLNGMAPGSSDSLLSNRDMHMFAYSNQALQQDALGRPPLEEVSVHQPMEGAPVNKALLLPVDSGSISSKGSGSLVAPPLQFRDSDPSVAVVKPSVIKQYGGSWLHPQASPVSANGSPASTLSNGHAHGVSDRPMGTVPPLNHIPPVATPVAQSNNSIVSSTDNNEQFIPRKSFLHTTPPATAPKPSAHVQPHVKTVRL